jgi:hypothetical protein
VHTCCCIGVFVLSGFLRIQNPNENGFGKVMKIKEKG